MARFREERVARRKVGERPWRLCPILFIARGLGLRRVWVWGSNASVLGRDYVSVSVV